MWKAQGAVWIRSGRVQQHIEEFGRHWRSADLVSFQRKVKKRGKKTRDLCRVRRKKKKKGVQVFEHFIRLPSCNEPF